MIQIQWVTAIVCLAGCAVATLALSESNTPKTPVTEAYQSAIQEHSGTARELAEIRFRIAQARQALDQKNRLLNQRQREAELKDPIAKRLRADVVALEKAAVEARRSLNERLEAIEDVRAVSAERRALMAEVKELRTRERALLGEQAPVATVSSRPAGS